MNIGKAILMGLIQGLTEFLPVSSSGHLSIVKCIFNLDTDTGILFDILLHVATLIAICAVYYRDIIKLIVEFFGIVADLFHNMITFFKNIGNVDVSYRKVVNSSYRKFVVLLIVSTIPTGILGFLLKDIVEYVGSSLLVPGVCLIGTGIILIVSDLLNSGNKKPKDANYGDAFAIGAAQGIATLPGLSRSGSTITACLLCGFDRRFATKYSFIMSIPAVIGAFILEISDISKESISGSDVGCYIVGMVVAVVVGYIALRLTMKLVAGRYFKYFAYYCLAVGAIAIIAFVILL